MAVKTASVSGAWSVGATWGGSIPVDGDSVVIDAGISVLMDVDTSAWTGLLDVTINTSSETPGMLYWKNGTNGVLKLRGGYSIKGSGANTNLGRILINSDGVWGNTGALQFSNKAQIILVNTATINAQYLDIMSYCTEPTNKFVRTYGTKYVVTVDGSTFTGATLSNDTAVCIRSSGIIPAPLEADVQYYVRNTSGNTFNLGYVSGGVFITLTNTGSGTIEVYTGVDSGVSAINVLEDVSADTPWTNESGHNAVVLCNYGPQNYDQQRTTISSISSTQITLAAATDSVQRPGARIYLSSRNVSIQSNITSSEQAIIQNAVSGVIGAEIKNTAGSGTAFYGRGLSNCSNCNPSGPITGCIYGLSNCSNCNPSGPITGCNCGLQSCSNCNPSGPITGCNYGLSNCSNCNPSGPITGCNHGLQSCSNCNPSGPIIGNTNDVNFGYYSLINQRNKTSLLTVAGRNARYTVARITYENFGKVLGAHRIYDNFGDIIKVNTGDGGSIPSFGPAGVSGPCLEVSSLQSNLGLTNPLDIIREVRVWVEAGTRTVAFKIINNFTSGIAANGMNLSINYTNSEGNTSTISSFNSTTLLPLSDWSQSISTNFTCLGGWIDITLSLWAYESGLKQIYVWPTPIIT